MDSKTKTRLWFGILWGLFLSGALFEVFVIGDIDVEGWLLSALVIAPSISLVLRRKVAGIWLIAISITAIIGFTCRMLLDYARGNGHRSWFLGLVGPLIVAAMTGWFGLVFLRIPEENRLSQSEIATDERHS
ncbi:MAG TPA: hypothetical protein VGG42_01810 [Acidobacteriaceae bacterium]|jgi:hypothetical protein